MTCGGMTYDCLAELCTRDGRHKCRGGGGAVDRCRSHKDGPCSVQHGGNHRGRPVYGRGVPPHDGNGLAHLHQNGNALPSFRLSPNVNGKSSFRGLPMWGLRIEDIDTGM